MSDEGIRLTKERSKDFEGARVETVYVDGDPRDANGEDIVFIFTKDPS
tara:strand:- start:2516 stop:2659 length:144 start_codon:yes stop_codon:yes gene_type:complete